MKANELRIGNWVEIDNPQWPNIKGKTFQVTSMEGNVSVPYNIRGVGFSQFDYNIEPIQLTQEWLLYFGFKFIGTKNETEYFFGENPLTNDWMFKLMWLNGDSFPFYKNGHHKIKYVHQLQNLYFALTGEELTYGGNK